jgi:hypothetical protein
MKQQLQRKQRRRRKTEVVYLRRANPNANERETTRRSRSSGPNGEEEEWPEVDDVRGAERDPAVFATVERDLATMGDGEIDECKARFPAAHPAMGWANRNPRKCPRPPPRFAASRGRIGGRSNGIGFDD